MKRLAVLRHAKAERDSASGADFDRPLAERGRDDARRLGRELARRGLRFDLVLASPAARVRETVEGLGATDIRFEPRIYEAGLTTLLDLLRAVPEACQSVLLVGHNPGVQELLLDLTDRDEHGFRDRVREQYPTAALALVELPDPWPSLNSRRGSIVDLILPRSLGAHG